jgi:hypothetical protein
MKIVKFKDGTYAIRRLNIFPFMWGYHYKDLRSKGSYWWKIDEEYFSECKGTLQECKNKINVHLDKGEPI